jgi:hypothetical protein
LAPLNTYILIKKAKKVLKNRKIEKKMQLEMKLIRKTEENIEIDKKK